MCGIADRVIRHVTEDIASLAAGQAAGQATEEALRGTAARIALRMVVWMAPTTMYDTTDRVTSGTTRGVVPRVRVSFPSLEPKATSRKQIDEKTVSSQFYEFADFAPRPDPAFP